MAGLTLELATERLESWIAADAAVATGQEYEIDTGNGRRRLKRTDAAEIRKNIDYWQAKVTTLSGTRRRIRYAVQQ